MNARQIKEKVNAVQSFSEIEKIAIIEMMDVLASFGGAHLSKVLSDIIYQLVDFNKEAALSERGGELIESELADFCYPLKTLQEAFYNIDRAERKEMEVKLADYTERLKDIGSFIRSDRQDLH